MLLQHKLFLNIIFFRKQSVELPPGFQPTSLKGRSFTPSLDLSCHNVQGINVWLNKGPKPYGKASSTTSKYSTQTFINAF